MIARYTWSLHVFLLVCSPSVLWAQANDECSNATVIAVAAPGSCPGSAIVGNNGSATDSGVTPSCDPSNDGYQDVWYSFNTGNNSQITITLTPLTATDWNYAIYDVCTGTELACSLVPTGPDTYMATPNADFILQVESNLDFGVGGTFELCIEGNGGGAVPSNDDCSGAITVPMLANCNPQTFDAASATPGSTFSSCNNGNGADDDVWFEFVATSADVRVEVDGNGSGAAAYDPVVNLVFSTNCATFNHLACKDDTGPGAVEVLEYSGINPGTTYYIQVYDARDNAPPATTTFTLCVEDGSSGVGLAEHTVSLPMAVRLDEAHRRIGLDPGASGTGAWELFDLGGRALAGGAMVAVAGETRWVEVPELSAGVYLVRVSLDGRQGVRRIAVH